VKFNPDVSGVPGQAELVMAEIRKWPAAGNRLKHGENYLTRTLRTGRPRPP
jgi:hypothetical protein